MTTANVIIITDSKTPALLNMTQRAIDSCLDSQASIKFTITIVESCQDRIITDYKHAHRFLKPNVPFNYNKFCNFGLNFAEEDWVAVCNNDLIFHPGWLGAIMQFAQRMPDDVQSFTPWNRTPWPHGPVDHLLGYGVGGILGGWCIVAKKTVFQKVRFDERVNFWCSDNLYARDLERAGIRHALVRDSHVTHLGGQTLFTLPNEKIGEYTAGQAEIFGRLS